MELNSWRTLPDGKGFATLVVLAVTGAAIMKLQQWVDRRIAPWVAHDNR
jgi:hypothetical protein